jgi:hypothetical protein
MTFEELLEAVRKLGNFSAMIWDSLKENGCEIVVNEDCEATAGYVTTSEVYHHAPSGRFLKLEWWREGEYWSGFDYSLQDVFEVEPKIVTKTEYFKKEENHE